MQKTRGFTLIELMIVTTIIGILMAIAIPSYHNMITRTRVIEGINIISSVKFAVYEYFYWQNSWPADNAEAGVGNTNQIVAEAVKSVEVKDGIITITYNPLVSDNQTIIFTPSSVNRIVVWDCKKGTLPDKYRPPACRN